jgi:hypothetical protein
MSDPLNGPNHPAWAEIHVRFMAYNELDPDYEIAFKAIALAESRYPDDTIVLLAIDNQPQGH